MRIEEDEMIETNARRGFFVAVTMILFFISAATSPSRAQLTISQQFNFSDVYGVNPIGNGAEIGSTGFYSGGLYDSVGANSVTPSAGTNVTASQNGVVYTIPFSGVPEPRLQTSSIEIFP
jgi:hypothetical protein